MNMNNKTVKDYYQTSDLACAAVLSLSFPIELVDRSDPRRACFMFNRTENLDEFLKQYLRGELRVEPRAFFNAIKTIKIRLYEPSR